MWRAGRRTLADARGPPLTASATLGDHHLMSFGTEVETTSAVDGPTRPDRITIWPVEDGRYGIDVAYRGTVGFRRAEVVERHLRAAGVPVTFLQEPDGAWAVRFGPVDRDAMLTALNSVVW